jgi:hypothetical protein
MKTKTMVIIRGRGTPHEKRIETNIKMYYSESLKRYATIPGAEVWYTDSGESMMARKNIIASERLNNLKKNICRS